MNIEAYNRILERALDELGMTTPDEHIDLKGTLEGLENDLLWFSHYLIKTGRLRDDYSEGTRNLFDITLLQSLRILRDVCCVEGKKFDRVISEMRKISEEKNHDYSGINILKGMHLGLVVRMGDKISRILNLISMPKGANKVSESLIDTCSDLVNYSIYLTLLSVGGWSTRQEIRSWVKELRSRKQDSLADAYKYTPPHRELRLTE